MAQPTTAADQEVVFLADGIDLVRDSRLLLNQVSFTVRSGEHWALLGPNGAGKSTLLRLLATYAHPTRGRIDILGRRLGRVDVFTLRPLIALVSSHQPVHAARTVHELVLTGATGTTDLRARWTPSAADLRQAEAAIEVMGLRPLAGARWPVLSQGERSRALIARGLAGHPQVLLLDEPAAGLDLAGREQLLACIDDLRERHPALATVLVTHHLAPDTGRRSSRRRADQRPGQHLLRLSGNDRAPCGPVDLHRRSGRPALAATARRAVTAAMPGRERGAGTAAPGAAAAA